MNNAEKLREKRKKPKYRAIYLISGYRRQDKLYNRGECTLTQQDIFDLWKQGCHWCGETDWHKLGADRIDNSKPHSKENCVCACWKCNTERSLEYLKDNGFFNNQFNPKSVVQYTLGGEVVAEYKSITEAARENGIGRKDISNCCREKIKSAGGFIWKYKTLI